MQILGDEPSEFSFNGNLAPLTDGLSEQEKKEVKQITEEVKE